MTFVRGSSQEAISSNISHLMHSGHEQDQSVAIAMKLAGKSKKKKMKDEDVEECKKCVKKATDDLDDLLKACTPPLVEHVITNKIGHRQRVCEYPEGKGPRHDVKHPKNMSDQELWQHIQSKSGEHAAGKSPEVKKHLDAAVAEYKSRRTRKGKDMNKATDELDDLLKADRSHLARKIITNRRGHRQTVYVNPRGEDVEKTSASGSEKSIMKRLDTLETDIKNAITNGNNSVLEKKRRDLGHLRQNAVESGAVSRATIGRIEKLRVRIDRARRGEGTMKKAIDELDDLLKARDLTRLQKVVITNKLGRKQTVYRLPPGATKKGTRGKIDFSKMSDKELLRLHYRIETLLKEKYVLPVGQDINQKQKTKEQPVGQIKESSRVRVKLGDQIPDYTRYNGGWVKAVTGIDKRQKGGYSLEGGFADKEGSYTIVKPGRLYVDCSIGGSRKNRSRNYTLFTTNKDGTVEVISETSHEGGEWALNLHDAIEKFWNERGAV